MSHSCPYRSETVPALGGGTTLPDWAWLHLPGGGQKQWGELQPRRQQGDAASPGPRPSREHPWCSRGGGGWGGAGRSTGGAGGQIAPCPCRWSQPIRGKRAASDLLPELACFDSDTKGSVESILLCSIQLSSSLLAAEEQSSSSWEDHQKQPSRVISQHIPFFFFLTKTSGGPSSGSGFLMWRAL